MFFIEPFSQKWFFYGIVKHLFKRKCEKAKYNKIQCNRVLYIFCICLLKIKVL